MENVLAGKCLLLLIYPTIEDIRCGRFYVWPVAAISLLLAGAGMGMHGESLSSILKGCLPGLAMFGISRLSRGAVGSGDAAVLTGLGSIAGWQTASHICLLALFFCSFIGLLMIMLKKANRKTAIPFIPFLTISLGWIWLFGG